MFVINEKDDPNPKLHKEHRALFYRIVQTRRTTTALKNKTHFHFSFLIVFFLRKVGTLLYRDDFCKGVEKNVLQNYRSFELT